LSKKAEFRPVLYICFLPEIIEFAHRRRQEAGGCGKETRDVAIED
jgi:hypothetical protein